MTKMNMAIGTFFSHVGTDLLRFLRTFDGDAGGIYRIIDFTLSNCINSGLSKCLVFTQYKSDSLNTHILDGWNFLSLAMGDFVRVVPPQQRINSEWYRGTADCVHQNLYSIRAIDPKRLIVLSGDHIYKMDYRPMIDFHTERVACQTL